jgi:hypothetical protein
LNFKAKPHYESSPFLKGFQKFYADPACLFIRGTDKMEQNVFVCLILMLSCNVQSTARLLDLFAMRAINYKQSHYRPGEPLRVPAGGDFQISK